MSRKIKYSKELKLEIVRRYLKGESTSLLANEYSLGGSTESGASRIRKWVCKYEQLGETAFDFLNYNHVYSKQLKETVVREYLNGSTTYLTCSILLVIKNNKKYIVPHFFMPSEVLQKRVEEDNGPYDIWVKKVLLHLLKVVKTILLK